MQRVEGLKDTAWVRASRLVGACGWGAAALLVRCRLCAEAAAGPHDRDTDALAPPPLNFLLQFSSNRDDQQRTMHGEVLHDGTVHNLLMHVARQQRHQLDRQSPRADDCVPSPPASKRLRLGRGPVPGLLQGSLSPASGVAEQELALSEHPPASGTASGLNRATSGSNASDQLSLAASGLVALDALAAVAEQEWEQQQQQQQVAQAGWEQRQQQLQQQQQQQQRAEKQQLLLQLAQQQQQLQQLQQRAEKQQLLLQLAQQQQQQQHTTLPQPEHGQHYHLQRLLQHLVLHLQRCGPTPQLIRQPLPEPQQQQQAPQEQLLPREQPLSPQQQRNAAVQLLHRLQLQALLAQQQPAACEPPEQPLRPFGVRLTPPPLPPPPQQPSLAELQRVTLQALLHRLPISTPQQQQELSSQPTAAPLAAQQLPMQ